MEGLENYQFSLLREASSLKLETKPFPHLLLENALPKQFVDSLTSSFPLNEFQLGLNNKRISLSVSKLNEFEKISAEWKEFLYFHSSSYFLSQFIDLFKDHLSENNKLLPTINNHNLKVGRRGIDLQSSVDVLIDAQIAINTPVKKRNSVIGLHVDNSNKLFSGMFYLRRPEDTSVGGNLRLYSWKEGYSEIKKIESYKEGAFKGHVTLGREIDYRSNVFVLWPNSLDSLHSVTPRDETEFARTFVNFHGYLPFDSFQKQKLTFLENKVRQFRKIPRYVKTKIYKNDPKISLSDKNWR